VSPEALALHGVGESEPGDEAFLHACLKAWLAGAAARLALARAALDQAASGFPAGSADAPTLRGAPLDPAEPGPANAPTAPGAVRVAVLPATGTVMVVGAASAASGALVARLAGADLVYLP
jgi:hypothetical protein